MPLRKWPRSGRGSRSRGGVGAAAATSFTDVSTARSTAYTYTVTASDAAGNTSVASSGASVTTPAALPPTDTTTPSVPAGLTATAAPSSQIDLSWSASTDDVAVTGYRLYRDGTFVAVIGTTSWSDTGLGAGSSHTYAVSARDAAGHESATSTAASATTAAPDTTAPSVPTNLSATAAGPNLVNMSWVASTDALGVTSYSISRNGTVISKVASTVTSFVDVTTVPGTSYTYSVSASDAAGNTSAASNSSTVITPAAPTPSDTTPPSAPSNLSATVAGATEIDLTWTASTDNTAVAGYRVYRNGTQVATTGSTSYADTPLQPGASNSYYVIAIDAAYNASPPSNTASASTPGPDTTDPSAPTNVTVSAPTYNATTVAWSASTDDIAVVGYAIRANGSIVSVVDGSTTSFLDATTLPSMTYLYTVTAFDAAGNTAQSSSVSVTTPAAAPSPDTTKLPAISGISPEADHRNSPDAGDGSWRRQGGGSPYRRPKLEAPTPHLRTAES